MTHDARLVALTMLAGAGCPIYGEPVERCPPIVFGAPHDSLDGLAAQTLEELFVEGGSYESGGFFIEQRGAYYASRPVTQRGRRAVSYCIVLPRDARLAGLYHTHVASAALSARDRSNAERAGVPSYIGTLRDRSLLVYDGRSRELQAMERSAPVRAATTGEAGGVAAEQGGALDDGDRRSLRARLAEIQRRAAAFLAELSQRF